MSIDKLMALLAHATDWGDQSLSVTVGYKRARDWDGNTESTLNQHNKGFVVSTTICCPESEDEAYEAKAKRK